MLKKIKDKTKELISLHVAGATVRHAGRFSNLNVFENEEPLDKEFIATYVIPFYMCRKDTDEFREKYFELNDSMDVALVSKLMGDFGWRPRSVGAYFAALCGMDELEENIGNLLLRSDVCYAGHDYCLALASFSSPRAIHYLERYLEYYLEQPELWFDQSSAMAALSYIGAQKDEDILAPYMTPWNKFVANKPNWNLEGSIEEFSQQMQSLNECKYVKQ